MKQPHRHQGMYEGLKGYRGLLVPENTRKRGRVQVRVKSRQEERGNGGGEYNG